MWHVARVYRYANQAILQLDGGEGKYYAESYPDDRFRLISLSPKDVFGGAMVTINEYSGVAVVHNALEDSCLSDVRLEQRRFPLEEAENAQSDIADVVRAAGVLDGCVSDACVGVTCANPMVCVDRWKSPYCR